MAMKGIYGGIVMVATLVILVVSSAQAEIAIRVAEEVQDSRVSIKGTGAARGAPITWEGVLVTTANKGNGSFSFFGNVPDDCTGELSDGNETVSVTVLDCAVVAGISTPPPKTGQTVSIAPGDDGALQRGVPWPMPRFRDKGNGTVRDNLTGLIWLKDANCFQGIIGWSVALGEASALASGACGLSDGSRAGAWRLPNRNELASLLDLNKLNPALPSGHPFTNFQAGKYWTSTLRGPSGSTEWLVDFSDGSVTFTFSGNFEFVIFVRDDTGL